MLYLVGYSKKIMNLSQQEIFKIRKQLDPLHCGSPKNYYALIIFYNYYIIPVWWFDGRYILASLNASF